jgi:hypothetical protein
MKRLYLFFLATLFMNLACPLTSIADGEVIDGVYYSDQAMEKMRLLQKLQEAINDPNYEPRDVEPFTGYGRVLDQHDNPVANAKVEAHWWRNEVVIGVGIKTHTDTVWVDTDQNGNFSVTTPNGAIPRLYGVKAKGYERQKKLTPYYQGDRESMMENSVNDPIIVYMRKLNPTTFVLKNETGYYFKESITHLCFTLNQGLLRKIDPDLSKIRKPEQNDFIFVVSKNQDNSFTVQIQPIPAIGGSMQILGDYLYEAPAEGYGQQATLTICPADGDVIKYLYFTSRNPAVYSRMTMDFRIRDDGQLSFSSTTWTNPYGKRNLEWEPELPSKLETRLFLEAETALKTGRLASEPVDLDQLIKQYAD